MLEHGKADRWPDHLTQLGVALGKGGGQWRDIDRVTNRLVARRIDNVAQHLLGILNRATLLVAIAQKDEFLLLACPESAHTFAIDLDANE